MVIFTRGLLLPDIPVLLLLKPILSIHHADLHVGLQLYYFYKLAAFGTLLGLWCLQFRLFLGLSDVKRFSLVIMFDLHRRIKSSILQDFNLWLWLKIDLVLTIFKILFVLDLSLNLWQTWVCFESCIISIVIFEEVYSLDDYKLVPVYPIIILFLLSFTQNCVRVDSRLKEFWWVFNLLLLIFFKLESLCTNFHYEILVSCILLDPSSSAIIFFVDDFGVLLNQASEVSK